MVIPVQQQRPLAANYVFLQEKTYFHNNIFALYIGSSALPESLSRLG